MRLLNTASQKLEEFADPKSIPEYAIFSHRWREEEVQFKDIGSPSAQSMKGYSKVISCCEAALQHGYDYLWIDTCCIDKSSSSELSEAINSMFAWYRDSAVCFVLLDDVSNDDDSGRLEAFFREAEWFKRGWTLQELIAPPNVVFFASDWVAIGTKVSFSRVIAEVTRISDRVFLSRDMENISVATRMSWASGRETTREEDRAYSLLGIFGINMPPLYGEGQNAFTRLQEEITKLTNDYSIFVWCRSTIHASNAERSQYKNNTIMIHSDPDIEESPSYIRPLPQYGRSSGLLASSPDDFKDCHEVIQPSSESLERDFRVLTLRGAHSLTNKGRYVTFPVELLDKERGLYLAYLACTFGKDGDFAAIFLQSKGSSQMYTRISPYELPRIAPSDIVSSTINMKAVYVLEDHQSLSKLLSHKALKSYHWEASFTIHMVEMGVREAGFAAWDYAPAHEWIEDVAEESKVLQLRTQDIGRLGHYGTALIRNTSIQVSFAVVVGIHLGLPWADIVTQDTYEPSASAQDIYERYGHERTEEMSTKRSAWTAKSLGNGKRVAVSIKELPETSAHQSTHMHTLQLRIILK